MIKALGFRVLVEKDDIETTSDGGIVLVVDEKLEKHSIYVGTIVSIGDKAWKAYSQDYTGEAWANVGDKVIFSRHAGWTVIDPADGKEYTLLSDDDIAAVVTEDK